MCEVDDRLAVGPVLDLAGLGLGDGLLDVVGDRSHLRVRHLAGRAEDAAEAADGRHHVGGGDDDVEVVEALFDLRGELVGADDVGSGGFGVTGLVALGEDGDLARPCRGRWAGRACRAAALRRGAR